METLTLNLNQRYSFADYLTWFDNKRRELYEGFINIMAAPRRKHQKISGNIFLIIGSFLKNKKCEVYSAPFDVRLPKNGEKDNKKIYTVVQPDIVVVCNPQKIRRQRLYWSTGFNYRNNIAKHRKKRFKRQISNLPKTRRKRILGSKSRPK